MRYPARSAAQVVRVSAAALLASAGAGLVASALFVLGVVITAIPSAPIYGPLDLLAGLVLTLGWLGIGLMFGTFGGVVVGFVPAIAAGITLASLEQLRLVRGSTSWLLTGALIGALVGHWHRLAPPMGDGLELFDDPAPFLLLCCTIGGAADGWIFRDTLQLLHELFPAPDRVE